MEEIRTIDDYMNTLPEVPRATLEKIRHMIWAAAPEATEDISFNIPTFRYKGVLVAFACFKGHCGLYLKSKTAMEAFRKELKAYDTSSGTIRFPYDEPLPAALVKKIVRARMKENEVAEKEKRKEKKL